MARAAYIISLGVVFTIASGVSWYTWEQRQLAGAEIHVLDVGQGDAIHIRTREGDDVLIDGGPDASVVQRLGEVMPFWDRTIELMIASHPDADHITGLVSVFDSYTVLQVASTPFQSGTALEEVLVERVAQAGASSLRLVAGDRVILGSKEIITILSPPAENIQQSTSNDASLVLLYVFFGSGTETRFLSTGDITSAAEQRLVAARAIPNVDILKVAHHGSKTSSSEEFLAAADPDLSLISVGRDNQYGHPHAETLNRLSAVSEIYQTADRGTITVTISDEGYLLQE